MNSSRSAHPLFETGRLLATPGALELLDRALVSGLDYVRRHETGDFGVLDADDVRTNLSAISHGGQILSAYEVAGEMLWIITEADRSVTTLLLPREY